MKPNLSRFLCVSAPLRALLLLTLMVVYLAACATPPKLVTAPAADPVAQILADPDARAVARTYPKFFTRTLNTVAELKHDLEVLRARQP